MRKGNQGGETRPWEGRVVVICNRRMNPAGIPCGGKRVQNRCGRSRECVIQRVVQLPGRQVPSKGGDQKSLLFPFVFFLFFVVILPLIS
jgi:hypothetical protein